MALSRSRAACARAQIFECVRKISLVGLPVFFTAGSVTQRILALLVCFLTYGAYCTWAPFVEYWDGKRRVLLLTPPCGLLGPHPLLIVCGRRAPACARGRHPREHRPDDHLLLAPRLAHPRRVPRQRGAPVSYTHLTLPTILLV